VEVKGLNVKKAREPKVQVGDLDHAAQGNIKQVRQLYKHFEQSYGLMLLLIYYSNNPKITI